MQCNCTNYFMAQEAAPEAPAACSSSTSPANMWDPQLHAPSWNPYAAALLAAGADSSSSGLRPPSEHAESHVWNPVLLSTEQGGESSGGYRENFLELLASKGLTSELFDDVAPCDYLKKMEGSTAAYNMKMEGSTAAYNMSSCLDSHFVLPPANPMAWSAASGVPQIKYGIASSPLYSGMSCVPCYEQQQEVGTPMAEFFQQMSPGSSVGIQSSSLDYSYVGIDHRVCPPGTRDAPDFASFSGYRSAAELMWTKPSMKCIDLSGDKKQEQDMILSAVTSSSGSGAASDGNKRKSEERSEGIVKKSKQDISSSPPLKVQAPKVKLGEKITALQQIVSPFGKTDTASVLFETIKYIKFLHEQLQLLSEPYMKVSTNKSAIPWGDAEKEEKAEGEHDLRSRGLCLLPVSWTPQMYRDNNAPDYWTPTYRSCLYR